MEKDRTSRTLAVIAMLIAVVGLSVGFAAFTRNLQISAGAEVDQTDTGFSVRFSSSATAVERNEITPTSDGVAGASGTTAHIGSNRTISDIGGKFTTPGQKVTYEFYVYNEGDYDAFLKSITYANADTSGFAKCTAGAGTTAAMVTEACKGFQVTVEVKNENDGETGEITTTETRTPITQHKLSKKKAEKVTVTVEYKADAAKADGDFTVDFGNITLLYSTADASN